MKQMKHLLAISCMLMAMFTFMACNDTDDDTQAPSFESVSLSRYTVEQSDTVTLKLNVKDKGKNAYIWRCEFGWVNQNDKTDTYSLSLTKEISPVTLDNPTYVFKAPNNPGIYIVSITPKISYVAGKTLYSDGPTLSAKLVVVSKSDNDDPEF